MEGHCELWLTPEDLEGLDNLETIKHRSVYRYREYNTTELALTSPSLDPDGISDLREVRLRSVKSEHEATILFHNTTEIRVRALWIDFCGNEVAYSIIEPGEKKRYRTYASHPWIVRDIKTHRRLQLNDGEVIFAKAGPILDVTIKQPPLLEWNEENHRYFDPEFQERVLYLLLCHHRLERGEPTHQSIQSAKNDDTISHPPEGTAAGTGVLTFGDVPGLLNAPTRQTLLEGWEMGPDLMPVTLPEDIPIEEFLHTSILDGMDFSDDEEFTDDDVTDLADMSDQESLENNLIDEDEDAIDEAVMDSEIDEDVVTNENEDAIDESAV